MPVYEYVCKSCSRSFEELMFPGDPPPVCPVCASPEAERVLSAFAVGHSSGSSARSACADAGPGCGGCCGDPGSCRLN